MRFRNLERFRIGGTSSRMRLGLALPRTPAGRVYRWSPNKDAPPRLFVLGNTIDGFTAPDEAKGRMKQEPGSPKTVCPYSGIIGLDDEFTHADDQDAAFETVAHAATMDVAVELDRMLSDIARKSRGFMKYTPGRAPAKPKPRFSRRDLMRELVCDHCGRDYGVFAIALFCPDCGAPNLRLHFERETELIDAQLSLAEGLANDQEELGYRLIGNAHEDVLTAFEATQKVVYAYGMGQRPAGSPAYKLVMNDFQNVDRAQSRFQELNLDPFLSLDADAADALRLNVQKRHIIGHNLGVVDAKFAQHAQDARVGETVKLAAEDVRIFAGICQAVVDQLDAWLAGGVHAPTRRAVPPAAAISASDSVHGSVDVDIEANQLAKRIGLWLSKESVDGLLALVSPETLSKAFAENDQRDIEEALVELEMEGCIGISRHLGRGLPHISLKADLFATFDRSVVGTDPTEDSCQLAKFALEIGDAVASESLFAQAAWPLRRFNPALTLLAGQVDERRVIGRGRKFSVEHMHLMAEDRVSLKRYIERFER